jgi:CBS domain-containing protein
MTGVVFSVDEDATVEEVANMMVTGRIHRVFVTRAGKIVGVISSLDLLPLVVDGRPTS